MLYGNLGMGEAMKKVDLKDFIREFVNTIPKNKNKTLPIISLEFYRGSLNTFVNRIDIYRIESLKIVSYRFSTEAGRTGFSEWTVPSGEYSVINILPPTKSKRIGCRPGRSLAVIQVA